MEVRQFVNCEWSDFAMEEIEERKRRTKKLAGTMDRDHLHVSPVLSPSGAMPNVS